MNMVLKIRNLQYPNHNVSIILCGDFNSVPECGIYQLMSQNHIPEDYKDWNSSKFRIKMLLVICPNILTKSEITFEQMIYGLFKIFASFQFCNITSLNILQIPKKP